MEVLAKGWFTEMSPEENMQEKVPESDAAPKDDEINGCWPGQAFSLKVQEVLYHEKSKYQDILVFKSESYGNVLVLDGVIQCTERDEFSYQEMLAHIPLFVNNKAKKVLVIGGGDGGVVREILKHKNVDSVVLCEIDEKVIEAAKRFLPSMSSSLNDSKVQVHVGDGLKFMKENSNQFDVIITDSSDPVGPAETLFGESYYSLLNHALTEHGVVASQAESIWLHLDLIGKLVTFCRKIFPVVAYAYSSVPTYPSGVIGYLICSKDKNCDPRTPVIDKDNLRDMHLRFYNAKVHRASFILPEFATKELFVNHTKHHLSVV